MNKKETGQMATLVRLMKMIWSFYPIMFPLVLVCILFSAIVGTIPSIFMQNVISLVEQSWATGDWNAVGGTILKYVGILVIFYVLSLISTLAYTRMMAVITQGSLKKIRI